MTTFKVIVNGLVQGVGFRYFCMREAAELAINGYAKNIENGSVEIIAQGNEDLLKKFINRLKIGPKNSNVIDVKVTELEEEINFNKFQIF